MRKNGIICAMKDWKTYVIVVLVLWCAYLTWRTMPYQIWEANEAQNHSREDVYWIGNRYPTTAMEEKIGAPKVIGKVKCNPSRLLRKPDPSPDSTASKIQ